MKKQKICICSSNQNYVRVSDLIEWEKLYNELILKGFDNPHALSPNKLPPYGVVCVDDRKKWFCTVNVTVMACVSSMGKKTVSADEYLKK